MSQENNNLAAIAAAAAAAHPVEVKDGLVTPPVELEVVPSAAEGDVDVLVRVHVPDANDERSPVDLCCVIDISGSMGSEATRQDVDNPNARHSDGLTVLDVVKHAVKAVIRMLKDKDRLTVVAFDEVADIVVPLTVMDAAHQDSAIATVGRLQPRGGTDIWCGLLQGLDILRNHSNAARQKTVLLLTDGQPTTIPPGGYIPTLHKYFETHPNFHCQIQTFGFGYNMDSDLLLNMAKEGNGTYAFIPDAPIVGTVFVHSVANVLSTHSQRAVIHLTPGKGAAIRRHVRGVVSETDAPWGKVVQIGSLQYGQPRDIIVPMTLPADASAPFLEVTVEYGDKKESMDAKERVPAEAGSTIAVETAVLRTTAMNIVRRLIEHHGNDTISELKSFIERIDQSPAAGLERVAALKADLAGRVSKAIDGAERFNRWGKHYLRAWVRAHELQQCTNFMDKSVQVYGASLFSHLRSQGDAAFLALPPPRASHPKCPFCHQSFSADEYDFHMQGCANTFVSKNSNNASSQVSNSSNNIAAVMAQASNSANVDMSNYHSSSGGCFGADATVMVVRDNGSIVCTPVSMVQAGDRIRIASSRDTDIASALVKCVMISARPINKRMIKLSSSGLVLCPSHPVRMNGVWQRPDAVADHSVVMMPSSSSYYLVYNFVLDHGHVALVNGVECVTLGHGLQDAGARHEYWGSDRVVSDLSIMVGYVEEGRVWVSHVWHDAARRVVSLWSVRSGDELQMAMKMMPHQVKHEAVSCDVNAKHQHTLVYV